MPRPVRPDLEPEIFLRDTAEQQRRASSVIDQQQYQAIVYDRSNPIGRDRRLYIFDRIETRLSECRAMGVGIDEGFLFLMMRHIDLTAIREQRDENGEPIRRDGLVLHGLTRVGCRVRMTQADLGCLYGKGREFANQQIGKLKDWYFIVNHGRGWYEFAADLCWRGDLGICAAYRVVQRVRDGLIITDGTNILVDEDRGDDSGGGDEGGHTPPKG